MTIIIYITSRNRFLWDSCPRYHLSPAIPRLHRHSTGRLSDLGNPLALTQKGATCAGRLECCSWPFVDTFSSANHFWECLLGCKGEFDASPLKKETWTDESDWAWSLACCVPIMRCLRCPLESAAWTTCSLIALLDHGQSLEQPSPIDGSYRGNPSTIAFLSLKSAYRGSIKRTYKNYYHSTIIINGLYSSLFSSFYIPSGYLT